MEHLNEACWDGYKQVGMKKVQGRMVPNCIPIDEAFKDDIAKLIARGVLKKQEPKPDFKGMSPEERREYMANKAERSHPAIPLDMLARHGRGATKQQAQFALSTPMAEDEINEYCPRCLIEVLTGQHPEQLGEAQYQGRSVPLGKPMRGDVKKFKVFVKDPKTGNVKKVNFGDKTMKIKKSNPARRRSFRARHHCDTNPGPRTKARYWSCRKW
jgi:hypothetical protein